jgi:ribosomal protein S18 acetylase RimI-like enzyme
MQAVMLTVMAGNSAAASFYAKLGYQEHETSPGYQDPTDDTGYKILHKPLCQAKRAAAKTCLQDNTNIVAAKASV